MEFFFFNNTVVFVLYGAFQPEISDLFITLPLILFFLSSGWENIESILCSVLYSNLDNAEFVNQGFTNNVLDILSEQAKRPRQLHPNFKVYELPFFFLGLGVKCIGPYINDIISSLTSNIEYIWSNLTNNIQDIYNIITNNIQDISNKYFNKLQDKDSNSTYYIQNMFGSLTNYLNSIPQNFNTNFRVNMADRVNDTNTSHHYENIINLDNLNINFTPAFYGNQRPLVQITIFIRDIMHDEDYTQIHSLDWLFYMRNNPEIIIEVVDLDGVAIISRDISELPQNNQQLDSLIRRFNNEARLTRGFMQLETENIHRETNLHVFDRSHQETIRVINQVVRSYLENRDRFPIENDQNEGYLGDDESDIYPNN